MGSDIGWAGGRVTNAEYEIWEALEMDDWVLRRELRRVLA